MKVGDTFEIGGYDVYAVIDHYEGHHDVIVLNNNHNYFLVAMRRKEEGEAQTAVLEAEYEYKDEEECQASYTCAVIKAARLATPADFWPKRTVIQ